MKRWFQKFTWAFAIATTFALLARLCLFENFHIVSDSMSPTLLIGDYVVASKFDFNFHLPFSTYEFVKFRAPRRSEVVAFSLPDRGRETYVKRVVAIEGDKVAIREGKLVVNGVAIAQQTAENPSVKVEEADGVHYRISIPNPRAIKDYGPVDVPTGHFFVLGDNRAEMNDSRIWGPIPLSCLKGKIRKVWLSSDAKRSWTEVL